MKPSAPSPSELSRQWRLDDDANLQNRRWVVGLSLVGCTLSMAVTLYQTGIIKKLPDPPLPLIDSNKVDASDYAYKRFETPDGVMMLMTYATTALLAAMGAKDRTTRRPWLAWATGLKIAVDLGAALQLAREEWADNKALCAYCQVATLMSVFSLIFAGKELSSMRK